MRQKTDVTVYCEALLLRNFIQIKPCSRITLGEGVKNSTFFGQKKQKIQHAFGTGSKEMFIKKEGFFSIFFNFSKRVEGVRA